MHEIEFKSGSHNLRETFLSVKECQSIPHAKSKDLIPQIIDNSDYHESDKHPSLQDLYELLNSNNLNEKRQQFIQMVCNHQSKEILASIDYMNSQQSKFKFSDILNEKEQTLLHLVVVNDLTIVLEKILQYENRLLNQQEMQAWVNKLAMGFTAFHLAAYKGNLQSLEQLKIYGANFNIKSNEGMNAFLIAASADKVASMVWLILQGVSLFELDLYGQNALHIACDNSSENAVQYLLTWIQKLDINLINFQDNDGMTAIHLSVKQGNIRMTKKLLQYGVNLQIKNKNNETPLQIALINEFDEIVKLLNDGDYCFNKCQFIQRKQQTFCIKEVSLFFFLYIFCLIGSIIFNYPFFNQTFWLQYISIMLFVVGLIFYFLTMFISPGYIQQNKDKNKLLQLLTQYAPEELCSDCQIHKPLRSRHCYKCSRCVIVYDHHCQWLNNCIGANNFSYYLVFLIFLYINLIHVLILNSCFFWRKYSESNVRYSWFNSIYQSKSLFICKNCIQIIIILFCLIFFIPLTHLVFQQISNALKNQTTFEKHLQEQNINKNQLIHLNQVSISNCYLMCNKNKEILDYQK